MSKPARTRKLTIAVPEELLARVLRLTGTDVTMTIIEALEELERREKRAALRQLKGKVHFDLDLDATRR